MKNEIIKRQIDSLMDQRASMLEALTDIDRSKMNSFDSVNDINNSIATIDMRIDYFMINISEILETK